MGMLRLFLALVVVLTHVQPAFANKLSDRFTYTGLDAATAVEIFFVISGFYMALILDKKYTGIGSTWTFYVNRFTRIYPAYWVIVGVWLILELGRYFITGQADVLTYWLHDAQTFRWDTRLFLAAINFGIIGQDSVYFFHFTSFDGTLARGDFKLPTNPVIGLPEVWRFCLNPPAWSISLELMFYLLIPLLVRRSIGLIVSIAAASVLLKLWILYGLNLNHDPYTYRFFPAELHLFLFGVLAYRCQAWFKLKEWGFRALGVLAGLYFIFMLSPTFPGLSRVIAVKNLDPLFILFSILMLPVLFHLFGRVAWDRMLGELSFPVYLVHRFLIMPITDMAAHFHCPTKLSVLLTVGGTIGVAYLLNRFLIDPIELWRTAFYERRKAGTSPEISTTATP